MKPITRTEQKQLLKCPRCNLGWLDYTRLSAPEVNTDFGPWICDECLSPVSGTIQEGKVVSVEYSDARHKKFYDLLELAPQENRVFFIVEGIRPPDQSTEVLDYSYEEKNCPINFIPHTKLLIFQGDPDPHGLFSFLGTVPVPTSHRADSSILSNMKFYDLNKLFGDVMADKDVGDMLSDLFPEDFDRPS